MLRVLRVLFGMLIIIIGFVIVGLGVLGVYALANWALGGGGL